jgi:hypothetical protein
MTGLVQPSKILPVNFNLGFQAAQDDTDTFAVRRETRPQPLVQPPAHARLPAPRPLLRRTSTWLF